MHLYSFVHCDNIIYLANILIGTILPEYNVTFIGKLENFATDWNHLISNINISYIYNYSLGM
jgi:hypothetical protein